MQPGGRGVLAPVGDPQVSTSFNGTVGLHPGLGLGADMDELEQHPLPSVHAHVTQTLTSAHICQARAVGMPARVQIFKKS